MKYILFSVYLLSLSSIQSEAQLYLADSASISIFASTEAEDIDAINKICKPIMSTSTGEFDVTVINTAFDFKKDLMKEHFNKNYMESAKYPNTVFKGKIKGAINYLSDGTYNVTISGIMDMHGVQKQISVPGTFTVKGGVIYIYAKFNIKMADYNIKNPSVLGIDIADSVDVTVTATMKSMKTN